MLTFLKNKLSRLSFLLLLLVLAACDPGTGTSTGTDSGPKTDTEVETGAAGREKTPYSADKNLVDPLAEEFFDFYTRQKPFPFNPKAVVAMDIREIHVRQYSDVDNDRLDRGLAEQDLEISRRFDFDFDEQGRIIRFRRLAFIVGEPADSAELTFSYLPSGLLAAIDIQTPDGDARATATYQQDQLSRFTDPLGFSTIYMYDKDDDLRYETRYNKAGATVVTIFGPEGAFPDDVALELQAQVFERSSEFVDYGPVRALLDVNAVEEEGGQAVRELDMGVSGSIVGRVRYEYGDAGEIKLRRFREEGENPEVEEKRYHYNPQGDLVKVVFNEQEPGIDGVTAIHEFDYDEQGRLVRRIHSKKVGLGSTEIDRIDFFSYN